MIDGPTVTITCDYCTDDLEFETGSRERAVHDARLEGWSVYDDGLALCPNDKEHVAALRHQRNMRASKRKASDMRHPSDAANIPARDAGITR